MIECVQLTQVFRVGSSEVIALQGLDLSVAEGEMIGVVGASGSGKSTLMAVLSGLLRPTGGQATFASGVNSSGVNSTGVNSTVELGTASAAELDRHRRETIGMIWQDPSRNLVPYLTAVQNIALPLDLAGAGNGAVRAQELLDRVGLASRGDHRLVELSGGEQQRVALAVALAREPKVLLADEPTGALDRETTEEVFALMRSIGEETGLTQVIVSHDPELTRHVDRVVAIRDGRVAAEQTWVAKSGDTDSGNIDEVLVVDSIGRLQLTDEQRTLLGDDRVRAEIVDGAIHITPVHSNDTADGDGVDNE